jgi:glycosyltransferase involved in cell wall biosynthesis
VRIALDATYSIDKQPSGIAVYSREILGGLAAAHPDDRFFHCYRPKQYRGAPRSLWPNVETSALLPLLGGTFARPDIFHALNQRVDRRLGKRVVATFHDLFVMTGEYSSPDFRRRFAKQARIAERNSDLIIVVSQFTAKQVQDLLGVEPSRIRVIPHGVHSPRLLTRQEEKMVLSVGAIQLRKNTARLIEAFEALPDEWSLVLAGAADGYGAEQILSRIQMSPAKDRIQVAGYVSAEELERLYARAAIFAFPSLDEGFGMPVLDAMARGVPVVTSNCSAMPDVAGDAALLVDPNETGEIAAALLALAGSKERRESLSAAGRIRAESFSWRRALEQTYAVYRELVASQARNEA